MILNDLKGGFYAQSRAFTHEIFYPKFTPSAPSNFNLDSRDQNG